MTSTISWRDTESDECKCRTGAPHSEYGAGEHLAEFERRFFEADSARCVAQEEPEIDMNLKYQSKT